MLIELALDVLHYLHKEVVVVKELKLARRVAEADISGLYIFVHAIDKRSHQNEHVRPLLSDLCHQLLQAIIEKVTSLCEGAGSNHAL